VQTFVDKVFSIVENFGGVKMDIEDKQNEKFKHCLKQKISFN
jgi:hypothetical protein